VAVTPVGWGDVATRRDIVLMRDDVAGLRAEFVELEDRLHSEITARTRVMIFSLISTVPAVAGLGRLCRGD
jgi:hypothetical protein